MNNTILIADSGSTKTEWRLLHKDSKIEQKCITKGINPFHQNSDEILISLQQDFTLDKLSISEIHFYGAGCIDTEKNNIVKNALFNFFNCQSIKVQSDLVGAARSLCGKKPGIACILGTGSNSCLYNGKEIIDHISPLGYILGDEGSGAVLGKQLLGDVLKKQLPEHIITLFYKEYNTNRSEILDNIYKKALANKYLAQYTKFLSNHIEYPELDRLVSHSFDTFIKRNLLQYKGIESLAINFTGSVAFHFQDQLKQALNKHNLNIGVITQTPMDGLVQYHLLNLKQQ